MRKKLLTLGALACALSVNAQFLTYVGNDGQVFVKEGALVYNGGGMKTVGSGLVDNSGNIMVVGGTSSQFATVTTDGAAKTDGGNIILRMTNEDVSDLKYGQLYIKGLSQANITGVVDKQYKDAYHGAYQQLAIPFYNKTYKLLADELGTTISRNRWSQNELLVWNNEKVQFDQMRPWGKTEETKATMRNPQTAYYALGSKNFDASSAVKTVKGVPFADGITETLANAGASIDFKNGKGLSEYKEYFETYVSDSWETGTAFTGNYGKNIYQFGNPFLTNLDLAQLQELAGVIQGVRIGATGVATKDYGSDYNSSEYGTTGTPALNITYTDAGVAVGDVTAFVRPMQIFVVKMKSNTSKTLSFDDLRRFAYSSRATGTAYKVTDGLTTSSVEATESLATNSTRSARLSTFSANNVNTTSKVKQLGVIAQDENGNELGRTYFVVYPKAVTGQPTTASTQVKASSKDLIGTFEESVNGGADETLTANYWLYINEANEKDFKGKELPMRLYSDAIKTLKFEIREDAELLAENASLSNGESFFIKTDKGLTEIKNGAVLASTTDVYGLYYSNPTVANKGAKETTVATTTLAKPSDTVLYLDQASNTYKLSFDPSWNTAKVDVYNDLGQLISSQSKVNAKNVYTLSLPNIKGGYNVVAVSETGVVFKGRIMK